MTAAVSAHLDTFCKDHLPPEDQWPDLVFSLPELTYPRQLNCAGPLLEDAITEGFGDKPAIRHAGETWTYGALNTLANRYANVLTKDMGLVPGNRVMLRGANTPRLVAAWFAVMKAGLVAVTTMPLLRAKELAQIAQKAEIDVCLSAEELAAEANALPATLGRPFQTLSFGDTGTLDAAALKQPETFKTVATAQDDVCLLAFTSGTTGEPKACMHFHRDVLAMCDTFSRHIVKPSQRDVFIGTPPLAFTFGLGALLAFPFRARATVVYPKAATPADLAEAIQDTGASVVFTSPTAYRAILKTCDADALSSLRTCVSAGEHLPAQTFHDWFDATGLKLINGVGATEMIHIFMATSPQDPAGSTGRPVPGYTAALLDEEGHILDGPGEGRLAVKGPVGCRYLDDTRQADYIKNGWNITGDRFARDRDGVYWYQARSDSMIVSSGYNIAGPEVEQAVLTHPDVEQCAVIGVPDDARGHVVKAFIVPITMPEEPETLAKDIQDYVKSAIAPYKYPRQIAFLKELPKTPTGKISLSALKALAE